MTHLNYRRKALRRKERDFIGGFCFVDGKLIKEPWLIRTGKRGVVKVYAKDSFGDFILNRDQTDITSVTLRGRVKIRKAA